MTYHPMSAVQSVAWNPEHPGFSDDILPFYAAIEHKIPRGGTFCEVGVFLGRSLAFMGTIRPDLQLIGIDAWSETSLKPSHGDRATYDKFLQHMEPYKFGDRLTIKRTMSCFGILCIEAVDMIFIDADHDYPGVKNDIALAKHVVKPGGILSGHDYAGDNGVVQAVHELCGTPNVSDWDGGPLPGADLGKGRCWWVHRV